MIDCLFATCEELPGFDPDDELAAHALAELGVRVRPAVWNDASVDWGSADLCVLRSTWDYHRHPAEFAAWVDTVARRTRLVNPPEVVRWNAHKFYLRDLERSGVPIVPSEFLERGSAVELGGLLQRRTWREAVIKPAHGASAQGVMHVRRDAAQLREGDAYLQRLLASGDAIVQPYLESIATHHERALVFIEGRYSHAVTKSPFMHANARLGDRADMPPGASGEIPIAASAEEIAVAEAALRASPPGHVYARVDVVRDDDGRSCILETELIEPTLYLYADPSAPSRLARAFVGAWSGRA
jgi:glutathione synthase/RimK-type ligase-like ATP-grasp enzyme